MNGCMAKSNQKSQENFCTCVFSRLISRYTPREYVMMDDLIISGGQSISQFAKLAWEPEFAACRRGSPTLGR